MRRLLSISFTLALTASATLADPGGKLDLIVQPEPPSVMIGITTNGPAILVGSNIYESMLRL